MVNKEVYSKKMKIIGIIPARFASTRFPGKPLVDIGGKTMIQRVYEQAKKASSLSEVLVATDDQRIFDAVEDFGGKVVMTSSSHTNGTERCNEVAASFEADVVINIQGDEPFIQPEQINQLADLFLDESVQIGTLVKQIYENADLHNPTIIKAVLSLKKEALYFSRSAIPFLRTPDTEHIFFKHIGIYGFRKAVLDSLVKLPLSSLEKAESLEQLRWLENGYKIQTALTEYNSLSVDVPEDLEKLKGLY
jgi:3-deoxy-manno-octulosonate cytidylyltransferase (CMP-KDO synthetase)